jgi:hypothetical protein
VRNVFLNKVLEELPQLPTQQILPRGDVASMRNAHAAGLFLILSGHGELGHHITGHVTGHVTGHTTSRLMHHRMATSTAVPIISDRSAREATFVWHPLSHVSIWGNSAASLRVLPYLS